MAGGGNGKGVKITVHKYLTSDGSQLMVNYYFYSSNDEASAAFAESLKQADKVLEHKAPDKDPDKDGALIILKSKDPGTGKCFLFKYDATVGSTCSLLMEDVLAFIGR
jgi:hypothetical protein